MKLYTENQVRLLLDLAKLNVYGTKVYSKDELLDKLTPIELPSDEVIDKESFIINPPKIQNDYGKDDDDNIQYRDEWIGGAKWVIEQIKQQDK